MGLFDKILRGKPDYPELDSSTAAAARLQNIRTELKTLHAEAKQPLEVVPGKDRSYVFIGKPPKKFGVAWIEGGRVHNFKTLVEEHGVEPARLQKIAETLRETYEANQENDRFTASIGEQDVVVIASVKFYREVGDVIQGVLH